MRHTEKSKK